ncbi:L-histidine N(alpha)-methyltransferase [Pedobacter sp. HMF7647]|uniref:L-histidine N(Alpha)-methyltransferase n=2 Tax=Hufsiella arboris TaxID=2695275 RepID=A0A7K1YFF8_9SPHI|nr:L-histidine N(alpha)-methyltransferase [Hufsiella arboris]
MNDILERDTKKRSVSNFYQDVIKGLNSQPKHLESKYFYDDRGDELFQQIMAMPEYYLTDCELEIFKTRCTEMHSTFSVFPDGFDLIELGAGDAMKSSHLLSCLLNNNVKFTYYPIDISGHVIDLLETELPKKFPQLEVKGLQGEYFQMLQKASTFSERPKVLLVLGSNIGNMPPDDAGLFCESLRKYLIPGDLALIGFDLKKDPQTILNAYNDPAGITSEFNLNLLKRINRELHANFDVGQFTHYQTYDPQSGACKSFLISSQDQDVIIADHGPIHFRKNEYIFMEISQKYDLGDLDKFAGQSGFKTVNNLFDSKNWFVDTIWEAV